MKCTFSVGFCATMIATAGLMPVYGGESSSPPKPATQYRPYTYTNQVGTVSSRIIDEQAAALNAQAEVVQEFNELLNSGKLEQANNLAQECFLKNSSDPFAILMMKQVIVTRKLQMPQPLLLGSGLKSSVRSAAKSEPVPATCAAVTPIASLSGPLSIPAPAATCGPQVPVTSGVSAWIELRSAAQTMSQRPFRTGRDLKTQSDLLSSALKSCSGNCLTPLNAATAHESIQQSNDAHAPKKVVTETWPRLELSLLGPTSVDGVDFAFPNLPAGTVLGVKDPGSERMGIDFVFDSTHEAKLANSLIIPQPPTGAFVATLQPDFESKEDASESTISLYLIKGPMSTLDRLGIAIQGETPQISQPKLNAARDALPTPITIPVLTSVVEENQSQVVPPLVEMVPKAVLNGVADLSTDVYPQREKVLRHIGEPLATRRLSSEECQEILKAAQAAPRVGVMGLPKLTMSNDQKMDLSSSVIDSAGKTLELGLHSYLTSDKRAINLKLDFHSEQGPAALAQRVTIREFLESEEALLIALDAPISAAGLETVADTERQTSYLVVSPKLRKPVPAKVAYTPESYDYSQRSYLRQIKSVRKSKSVPDNAAQKSRSNDVVRRVYPVADLVVPVPDFIEVQIPLTSVTKTNTLAKGQANFKALIEKITSTISPNEWESAGGPGTIKAFDTTLSLVIRATGDTHDKIQNLLGEMRTKLDVQAALECHLIKGDSKKLTAAGFTVTPQDCLLSKAELSARHPNANWPSSHVHKDAKTGRIQITSVPSYFETIVNQTRSLNFVLADAAEPAESNSSVVPAVNGDLNPKLLSPAQAKFLLNELAKGCGNDELFPKVTLMNGQTCTLKSNHLDLKANIVVGDDRKMLDLTLSTSCKEDSGQCHGGGNFHGRIVDGESILFPISEVTTKNGDTVESNETILLLITPKVIIATEVVETIAPLKTTQAQSESDPVNPVLYVEEDPFFLGITR